MLEVAIPAFRASGALTTLMEVLDEIGSQPWQWRLLYFDGTSDLDSDLDVLDLGRMLTEAETDQGIDYTWPDLVAFAHDVEQAVDVTIVALDVHHLCVLVVEARDGTYWRIVADESDQRAVDATRRISTLR